MMADINKVSASKYDIYNKFLGIAEHYFGTNNDDSTETTDFLKSGLMGYITECMASVMRDSAIHKSMLYNESFLNTAIIDKSVYNWAKMFNVEIPKAQPAFADVMLTINVNSLIDAISKKKRSDSDLSKFGSDVYNANENENIFIIDRKNPLIAGSYYFILERSIIVERTSDTINSNGFIVRYCTTESPATTEYGDMDEVYLKTTVTSYEGESYLSFIVRVYQYKITTIEKQLTSNTFSDIKIHNFTFSDQLAGLRLKYTKNNVTQNIPVIFSDSITNKEELYAYYNIIDKDKVQIKFLNDIFLPSVGGTLTVDLFTTLGASGNASFNSDLVFSLDDEDYRSLAITAAFVDYQSYNGSDVPSLQSIKSTIISEISTRNVIVTESDLNDYFFKIQTLLESINDGKVQFIKKRDDLIKRTFNAYLLLRTGIDINGDVATGSGYRSSCIPTNTIDVTFPVASNISKKFGSRVREVVTDTTTNQIEYRYYDNGTTDAKKDDEYIIPFYMRIMLSPFKKVKYIYNITDDSTSLKYTNIQATGNVLEGKNSYIITPLTVELSRPLEGNIASENITVKLNFASNFELTKEDMSALKLTFVSTDTSIQTIYSSDSSNQAQTASTDTSQTTYKIDSTAQSDDGSLYSTTIEFTIPVSSEEFTFSNDDFGNKLILGIQQLKCTEDIGITADLDFTHDGSKFKFSLASERDLSLFRSLDSILNSDIVLNTETKSITTTEKDGTSSTTSETYIKSITLKEVPVVHSSFFTTDSNKTKFIKQLFTYIDLLNKNIERLETNTFFNLKFMNTYGYSYNYNSLTTNLDLKMKIYLKQGVDINDNALQNQIRDYIRVVVDKYNNEECLSVSTIITLVSAAYANYIDHIVFEGLNGTFTQYIDKFESTTDVPEFFNLDSTKLSESITFAK